ncbi:MAG: hypothetical protein CMJ78_19040 [Planctomycetaceae bacterium]|nr:hypothetical protein [Planctomycetaceae bacterium]
MSRRPLIGLATLSLLLTLCVYGTAFSADHGDDPALRFDTRLDINDLYAFQSPSNADNTVIIMTVGPAAGVLGPSTFHPNAKFDIFVDNNGDARGDIRFRVRFGQVGEDGSQPVGIERRVRGGGRETATGTTGANISLPGDGGTLLCDIQDDPFFFNLIGFRTFTLGVPGQNFFRGLNTMSIALEVPSSSLTDGDSNIGVYCRTLRGFTKQDRMGRPAINTVLIPGTKKSDFNTGNPRRDQMDFRQDMVNNLLALGNDQATADGLADFLLPDILTIDTSSTAGFPNGRRLEDDVIDIELGLLTGNAVTTDGVDNDSTFTDTFPYIGAANQNLFPIGN